MSQIVRALGLCAGAGVGGAPRVSWSLLSGVPDGGGFRVFELGDLGRILYLDLSLDWSLDLDLFFSVLKSKLMLSLFLYLWAFSFLLSCWPRVISEFLVDSAHAEFWPSSDLPIFFLIQLTLVFRWLKKTINKIGVFLSKRSKSARSIS